MPILDPEGHYNHVSTIDTIYNHPEAFNTQSHINWYNPYWKQVVTKGYQDAIYNYFKAITIDSFMDTVLAPVPNNFNFNSSYQIELNDMLHNNSGNIDFSNLSGNNPNTSKLPIVAMELANGTKFQVNSSGDFVCVNCDSPSAKELENAANAMLHHI